MGWFSNVIFKIKTYIRWADKFIREDLWRINLDELSKARARLLSASTLSGGRTGKSSSTPQPSRA